MSYRLNQALDCKREILAIPLPDPDDGSPEAMRLRASILAAADSTIVLGDKMGEVIVFKAEKDGTHLRPPLEGSANRFFHWCLA